MPKAGKERFSLMVKLERYRPVKRINWIQANPNDMQVGDVTLPTLLLHATQVAQVETRGEVVDTSSVRICSLKDLQVDAHSLRMQVEEAVLTTRIELSRFRKKETE